LTQQRSVNWNSFSELFTLQRGHDFGENDRVDHEVSTLVPMIRPLYGATGGRPNAGARSARRTKATDAGPDDDKVVVTCAKPIIPILFSKLSVEHSGRFAVGLNKLFGRPYTMPRYSVLQSGRAGQLSMKDRCQK